MKTIPTDDIARITQQQRALQRLALDVFGVYDRKEILLWMSEELGELVQAIRKEAPRERIASEYGDLLGLMLALSNVLDLDLPQVLQSLVDKELSRQLSEYGELKYWRTT